MIPHNSSMWEYLDGQFPSGYQDTLVLHMMYKPVKVCYERDQSRYSLFNKYFTINVIMVTVLN